MAPRLPPLNAIRVFAVVAQRLNFARAAEELGVTQSAVSKQVQVLEDFTGTRLFERKAQGVSLTAEGRELREAVLPAIDGLAQSFERYARRPPRSTVVRVTTTASFASMVMLPALAEFETEHNDIGVEILAGERLFELDHEEVDFAVRFGAASWADGRGEALGPQSLSPVACPSLINNYGGDCERVLREARRIQSFGKNEWFASGDIPAAVGAPARPPLMLENFHVAACAARLGHGVALLPTILLAHDLNQKTLVTVGDRVDWSEGFRLLAPSSRSLSPRAKTVADWVKSLAERSKMVLDRNSAQA